MPSAFTDDPDHRPLDNDPGHGHPAAQGMNPETDTDVGGPEEMAGAEGGILGNGEIPDPDADAAPELDVDPVEGDFPAGVLLGGGDDAVLVGRDEGIDIVERPS